LKHIADKGHTDFLILNGDILDVYMLSRWNKDPRARDFAGELDMVQEFLRMACKIWKRVVWKMGNHERRWWDYMQRKAPELIGIEALAWDKLIQAEEIGFDVVGWNQVIYAGELTILHGHEYGGTMFSPVNPARGAFIRAHSCTVSGHLHRGSHHPEPDIRGRLTSCWSHGCLCDLHPEYAPLTKWDHSFLLMDFDGKEWFELQLKKIIKGKIA
jgi:predicted phosphodiesterase